MYHKTPWWSSLFFSIVNCGHSNLCRMLLATTHFLLIQPPFLYQNGPSGYLFSWGPDQWTALWWLRHQYFFCILQLKFGFPYHVRLRFLIYVCYNTVPTFTAVWNFIQFGAIWTLVMIQYICFKIIIVRSQYSWIFFCFYQTCWCREPFFLCFVKSWCTGLKIMRMYN